MERNEIVSQMSRYICTELLNRPDYQLTEHQKLISGGVIDSFSLAQIGVYIEDAFGVYLPDTELTVASMDSLSQIADRIIEKMA